jgi:hypothetical protein
MSWPGADSLRTTWGSEVASFAFEQPEVSSPVISIPWYLLSAGIFIVIVGFLMAGVWRPSDSERDRIDAAMRDDEIIRKLRDRERIPLPNLVIAFGFLCILVSVVWRLIRLIA